MYKRQISQAPAEPEQIFGLSCKEVPSDCSKVNVLVVGISQFVSAAHASSPAVVDAVYVGEAKYIPISAHERFCDVVHSPSLQAQTVVLHVASVCGAPSGRLRNKFPRFSTHLTLGFFSGGKVCRRAGAISPPTHPRCERADPTLLIA